MCYAFFPFFYSLILGLFKQILIELLYMLGTVLGSNNKNDNDIDFAT